jgi:hypothetical protein
VSRYQLDGTIVRVTKVFRRLYKPLVTIVMCLCLLGAAFVGLFANAKLGSRHLQDDTNATVRLVANIFVVMTSLVLGLMMNSARNTLAANEHNVQTLATELILLDRTMRALGPQAATAHQFLVDYVQKSLRDANIADENPQAEALLDAVGTSLREIRLSDDQHAALWNDARQLYQQVVQQRWVVVDAAGGTIPTPPIVIVIGWLVIIFASFGYRAPHNAVVIASFVLAALLMSCTLFLILDMDAPTTGLIQVSNQPFQRVLAELQR